MTVLIPERGTPDELARSLRSTMTEALPEPLQVIVVVNGAEAGRYAALQRAFPAVEWSFHGAPLGFSRAVDRGLKHVRSDWVYLLNSDAEMRPGALAAALEHRAAGVFAVASRIHLRGADQRTEETNYNRLLREDGLATIHDIDPPARGVRDHAYAGGGSSLFCTLELRRFLAPGVYDPFYWEDVEWAWRARRCGLRVLFAAGSAVWHTRRATLHEYYLSEEIELVTRRNRLLFQLRNWLGADDTERAVAAVLAAPAPVREYFASPAAWLAVAAGRLWNWRHAATR